MKIKDCKQAEELNKELNYPASYIELGDDCLYIENFAIVKGKHKVRSILGDKKVNGYEIYFTDIDGDELLFITKHTFRATLRNVFEEVMFADTKRRIEVAIHKLALYYQDYEQDQLYSTRNVFLRRTCIN